MATLVDKHGNIAFYGHLNWGNFVDWLVTLCLGGIIMLTTVSLGGVRPDTHLVLLPLFVLLLALHGLWLAVDRETPKRLSQVPLWFVPGLFWMFCSVSWLSPVPWRGWYELIYALEIFIVLWVLANNVRTRSHLWLLILMGLLASLVAVFTGFYQFFQDSGRIAGAMTDYGLDLNPEFLGRATGVFADPNSLAALLLILLPPLLIVAAVRRLSIISRVLSGYIALMFLTGIVLTQSYWASLLVIVLSAIVPWFCFRRFKVRCLYSLLGVLSVTAVFVFMVFFHPLFKKGIQHAVSEEGEAVRLVLWGEALALAAENPMTGVGAGAYGVAFQQSPRVALADAPTTPHNDYLLVLSQLGFTGAFLFGAPALYIFFTAWNRWRKEPSVAKNRGSKGTTMLSRPFFLSLGLSGAIAFALCLGTTFVFYVIALALYGVLLLCILVKMSFIRQIKLSEHWVMRVAYVLIAVVAGVSFYALSFTKLEAHALELRAHQELELLVDVRGHVSGNTVLLEQVITLYEDAVVSDPQNADAWMGLSAVICQMYFQSLEEFEEVAERAVYCAERAVELSPDYWKTWAQLGVAQSFNGHAEQAEVALRKAMELAPNSSNAHYYYAAYLSSNNDRREESLSAVRMALKINPRNAAARRLEQKLLIL